MAGKSKSRYWWAVLYPENMVEDWEEKIDDLVEVPFAYCKHTEDVDIKSEHRKDHVHLILVFTNTTTYNHALDVFKLLGEEAVNTCKACINVRHCYDYLIHDTKKCKKVGKHKYDPSERITGNNFDIGAYEQMTTEQRHDILKELIVWTREKKFTNMADLMDKALDLDTYYFEVVVAHNAILERICRGNYLKEEAKNKARNS